MKKNSTKADSVATIEQVRSGRVSAQTVADGAYERWKEHADLNSLIGDPKRRVSSAAVDTQTALAGLPIVVKDNIDTADFPTTAATPALAGNRPLANAPALQRLIDAGAIVLAKANMHELAFGITSNNAYTGAVRNPHDKAAIAGGSSGGTAAAIAAGITTAGLGTDTGGSCRIPAALCGICGFRPTVGRYDGAGVVPLSHTRDTIGPLARSMRDITLLDSIMAGEHNRVPEISLDALRVGVPKAYFGEPVDSSTQATMATVRARLAQLGVNLVEAEIPNIAALNEAVGFPIVLHEFMVDMAAYLRSHDLALSVEDVIRGVASPDVQAVVLSLLGEGRIPQAVYEQALRVDRPKLRAAFSDYFGQHQLDAMICPTTPRVASAIGQDETVSLNGAQMPVFPTFIRNTDPGSNAGIPSVSIPAGKSDAGLPIGLMIDGPQGSDRRLLAIAASFEKALA